MISVSNVSMRYGAKILFDEVSTGFTPGKRYGLTGPNGSGKSTFMKLLSGEEEPQKGTVVRPKRRGVLSQDQFAFDRYRVIDTVIMGNRRLWAAFEERDKLYAKPEMTDADGMRLGELEGMVGEEAGYSAESDAAVLLQGLDIPDALHERKRAELQAGQKMRVLLAQALFGHPEALLLDEPTNHLDLDSIHWLEEFLNRYDGTLIVISHDRHFLNRVCTHIADIDYQTIITYTGGDDHKGGAEKQNRPQIRNSNPRPRGFSDPHRRPADRLSPRPPFPEPRLHTHRGYRLPDDYHLHRRVRRHGGRENADPLEDRIRKRTTREEDRAAQRLHRAV